MIDNDPTVPARSDHSRFRVSPRPGRAGYRGRTFLAGRRRSAAPAPETRFVEATGKSFNTSPERLRVLELVDELVQQDRRARAIRSLRPARLRGSFMGKPFARRTMREILEEAVEVGNATARTVTFAARPEEASPSTRARRGRARSSSAATSSRPAAADHRGGRRRGRDRRRPQAQFPHQLLLHRHRDHTGDVHAPHRYRLAVHLRDARQPRRVLRRRPQLSPHASARYSREPVLVGDPLRPPDPVHAPNGSTPASHRQSVRDGRDEPRRLDRHLLRAQAPGGKESNWLQTIPGKGWWTILRLYNPLQPFFDKTWRPSEIEEVS